MGMLFAVKDDMILQFSVWITCNEMGFVILSGSIFFLLLNIF